VRSVLVLLGFFAGGCELIVDFNPPPESGEQCNDGLDNDQNGLIDCRDPGCAGAPGCTSAPDGGAGADAGAPDAAAPDAITPAVCGNGVVDPPRPALAAPSSVPAKGAVRIAAADFNDDGILDLAVLESGATSSQVEIFLGDGAGFTSAGTPVALDGVANALAAGDANGDGVPDVVVAGGGTVTLLANLGGTFMPETTDLGGGEQTSIVLFDLDGDGAVEIAVASTTDVIILRRFSEGGFQVSQHVSVGTDGAARVAAGDLDGDGIFDLVVTQSAGHVAMVRGLGAELATPTFVDVGAGADAVALGDLDGDGRPDVVVASARAGEVSAILGTTATPVDVGGTPLDVAILDLDGDGDLDVAVSLADGRVVMLANDGTGALTPSTKSATLGGAGESLVSLYVDPDPRPDLAAAEPAANRVEILLGAGVTEECDGTAGCTASCTFSGGTGLWARAFGGAGADIATDVATDAAGNVYVVGGYGGTAVLGGGPAVTSAGMDDAFVVSFSAGGTFRWRTVFGGAGEDVADAVAWNAVSGELVVGGTVGATTVGDTTFPSPPHAFVARLDPTSGAVIGAVDPLGDGAVGETLTVAVDARGRVYAGGSFSGTVVQPVQFSGDGGWWTVIDQGQETVLQSFTSNDTNRVVRIRADERGPVLLVAFDGTIRELDDGTAFPAELIARYTPSGSPIWRFDLRTDTDPGILPADLALDPLGRAVAYSTFSGNLTIGENTITAQGASDGLLVVLTSDLAGVGTFPIGDTANGLGSDARGDLFLAGSTGLERLAFDTVTPRWTVAPNGIRARRFAAGPRGELYLAGRLIAATPIAGTTLTPSGASDAVVARIRP